MAELENGIGSHSGKDPWHIEMSRILTRAADLYLYLNLGERVRRPGQSQSEFDQEALKRDYVESTHQQWIVEITSAYLFETCHELRSIATLLSEEQIAASLEILVRAIVERCGRINWILDNDEEVTTGIRASRVSLEMAVSSQHYRRTLQSLYSNNSKEVRTATSELRKIRQQMDKWFPGIVKEVDSPSGEPVETTDVLQWVVLGERYPSFELMATWSFPTGRDKSKLAMGTYGILSSFGHPSVVASREHRISRDGSYTYSYSLEYLKKLVGNGLASFFHALKHWLAYFDVDHDATVELIDRLQDEWDRFGDAQFSDGVCPQESHRIGNLGGG